MALRQRTITARRLRREATAVERRFWYALRAAFPSGTFRRQHPVGRYFVDFACPARKLAIELDGGQHARRQAADNARSAVIATFGYRVIRFWNNDVTDNLNGVLATVRHALAAPPPLPGRLRPTGAEREFSRPTTDV